MIQLSSIVLSGFAVSLAMAPALANPMLFAGFTQTGPLNFALTSTSTPTASDPQDFTVVITGGGQVSFSYGVGGTPFSLHAQTGTLSLTATSTLSGTCQSEPNCLTNTPFTELGFSGSFSITRTTSFDGFSNLLSGTFLLAPGGAQLSANVGGLSATLEAATSSSNPNLVLTSDFLNFADSLTRDATFSLSSLLPKFPVITNSGTFDRFPGNFSAAGTGFFLSAPPPDVPEPSTFGMLAIALLGFGLWQGQRRLWRR